MSTIPRTALVAAIEAGIVKAQRVAEDSGCGPTAADCAALRKVGLQAKRVATGTFTTGAGCPVAQAFPTTWLDKAWDGWFAIAYDTALDAVAPHCGEYGVVEDIVDPAESAMLARRGVK